MSSVLWSGFGRCAGLVRDARRDAAQTEPFDDLAGLKALDYLTRMCDRARRKTDAMLFVSNEYLS